LPAIEVSGLAISGLLKNSGLMFRYPLFSFFFLNSRSESLIKFNIFKKKFKNNIKINVAKPDQYHFDAAPTSSPEVQLK
jgi:hypothetical protein